MQIYICVCIYISSCADKPAIQKCTLAPAWQREKIETSYTVVYSIDIDIYT